MTDNGTTRLAPGIHLGVPFTRYLAEPECGILHPDKCPATAGTVRGRSA